MLSHSEVASLSREQLLQRAKELQVVLDQKRSRLGTVSSTPAAPTGPSVIRFTPRPPSYAPPRRCGFSARAGPTSLVNTSTSRPVTGHHPHQRPQLQQQQQQQLRVRASHNRVFVRKPVIAGFGADATANSTAATATTTGIGAVASIGPPSAQGRLSPAGSLVSVASSKDSGRCSSKESQDETSSSCSSTSVTSSYAASPAESSSNTCLVTSLDTAASSPTPQPLQQLHQQQQQLHSSSPCPTPTPPAGLSLVEELTTPSWALVPTKLVVPVGDGSDDSDDDTDLAARAHSDALRQILHPKQVEQASSKVRPAAVDRSSVVYQTATKLVKQGASQRCSETSIAALRSAASRHRAKTNEYNKLLSSAKLMVQNNNSVSSSISSNNNNNKMIADLNALLKRASTNQSMNTHRTTTTTSSSSSSNTKNTASSNITSTTVYSKKNHLAIKSGTASTVSRQAQPTGSAACGTVAVKSPSLVATGSSAALPKSHRHVSKFKLTTIPTNAAGSALSLTAGGANVTGAAISPFRKRLHVNRILVRTTTSATATATTKAANSSPANKERVGRTPPGATRTAKLLHKTRFKLMRKAQYSGCLKLAHAATLKTAGGSPSAMPSGRLVRKPTSASLQSFLMVRGVPFQTSKGGKVLKRINTTLQRKSCSTTGSPLKRPKSLRNSLAAGRTYASGASITQSIVNRAVASQLVNRSIFKLNNKKRRQQSSASSQNAKEIKDCVFYIRFGKCHKGSACKFAHDPAKVSICTRFLKGTCKSATCPFSHNVSADRMPLCSYFQRGQCTAQACPYRHSYFRKDVPYCDDFLRGFCAKGQLCTKQHVLVCTDPECSRDPAKCPLRHKRSKRKSGSASKATQKDRKKVVCIAEGTGEAWPEFVTLSSDKNQDCRGADDQSAYDEVQLEMPARARTCRLKRFLERRVRPVWPDHSGGFSASPLDPRLLARGPGNRLRQLVKKARWMRRVPRPVRIPGEFIPLAVETDLHDEDEDDDSCCISKAVVSPPPSPKTRSVRGRWPGGQLSCRDDTVSDDTDNEELLELTYGDALDFARRERAGSVDSELSVSSYTSPEFECSSDDETPVGAADNNKGISTQRRRPPAGEREDEDEENDWLLEYLYSLEESPSPPSEPERIDYYGPIFERQECRVGDKIRRAINRYKRRIRGAQPKQPLKIGVPRLLGRAVGADASGGSERGAAEDFIPLSTQEEGEIVSEDELEGVDLVVVDMDLDSDGGNECSASPHLRTAWPTGAEEISSDEEGLVDEYEHEAECESGDPTQVTEGGRDHVEGAEVISDIEEISDVEEGEIL